MPQPALRQRLKDVKSFTLEFKNCVHIPPSTAELTDTHISSELTAYHCDYQRSEVKTDIPALHPNLGIKVTTLK